METSVSIADEIIRLQELQESGALTAQEFAEAKTKILAAEDPAVRSASDNALHLEIQRLKIQNEIIRLDQEWETERRQYMMHGKNGSSYIPNLGDSVVMSSLLVLLGIGLCFAHPNNHQHNSLLAVGILSILIGLWSGVVGCTKASRYEQAYEQYQQGRTTLTAKLDKQCANKSEP